MISSCGVLKFSFNFYLCDTGMQFKELNYSPRLVIEKSDLPATISWAPEELQCNYV